MCRSFTTNLGSNRSSSRSRAPWSNYPFLRVYCVTVYRITAYCTPFVQSFTIEAEWSVTCIPYIYVHIHIISQLCTTSCINGHYYHWRNWQGKQSDITFLLVWRCRCPQYHAALL
jgi:hypothetical protein